MLVGKGNQHLSWQAHLTSRVVVLPADKLTMFRCESEEMEGIHGVSAVEMPSAGSGDHQGIRAIRSLWYGL